MNTKKQLYINSDLESTYIFSLLPHIFAWEYVSMTCLTTYVLEFQMASVMTTKANCKSCKWETTAAESQTRKSEREANTRLTDKLYLYHTFTCNSCVVASYKEVK